MSDALYLCLYLSFSQGSLYYVQIRAFDALGEVLGQSVMQVNTPREPGADDEEGRGKSLEIIENFHADSLRPPASYSNETQLLMNRHKIKIWDLNKLWTKISKCPRGLVFLTVAWR